MGKIIIRECSKCGAEMSKKQCGRGWSTREPICWPCEWSQSPPRKPIKAVSNGTRSKIAEAVKFASAVYADRPHLCEECGVTLPDTFNGMCISHIISKGANPALYLVPRNVRKFCVACHHQWEFGDRKSMRLYPEDSEWAMTQGHMV